MANDPFENTWTTQSTTDRLNDPATPGKVPADSYDSYIETIAPADVYDMNDGCVPESKEAGGNLAKTQDNIRERFALETQDEFGEDHGSDKKLY